MQVLFLSNMKLIVFNGVIAMGELYDLVRAGQVIQGIKSDRAFALNIDIKPQVIVDLKAGRCMPNAENMLKMLFAAEMSVKEGMDVIQNCKTKKNI